MFAEPSRAPAPAGPSSLGEWRSQDCGHGEGGLPWSRALPVSQSPCRQGAPPPPGRSPQAPPQSPTGTSWSGELGTFRLSASGWHPQQRCGQRRRKPTENRGEVTPENTQGPRKRWKFPLSVQFSGAGGSAAAGTDSGHLLCSPQTKKEGPSPDEKLGQDENGKLLSWAETPH